MTTIHDDWQQRLAHIMETMREMSRQTDPQAMVKAYAVRMQELLPAARRISLSRRNLASPEFRVTRFSGWDESHDPWKDADRLPMHSGGLLSRLIYGNEPQVIDDLRLEPDDPAVAYLGGQRSLMAVPLFDQGESLNMVVLARDEPGGFDRDLLPEAVWRSNLFGRATHNLVLAQEVKAALELVDRELRVVADLQRSLLPVELPRLSTLELAASYQTSKRAGGDYYDVFPLGHDRIGILIADVSGHGTPAAVVMAVTHAIAHTFPGLPTPPSDLLAFVNDHLCRLYTMDSGVFVTAFYGIYDAAERKLTYASAGHNPPRLKNCLSGSVSSIDKARHLPLGIMRDEQYANATLYLQTGDQLVFYTDGITEATNPAGDMFGSDRLDSVLTKCRTRAGDLIGDVLDELEKFTAGQPANDDRTLVVGVVS